MTELIDSLGLPNRGDHLVTERELERRAQRCLAVLRHVEEVSFNVAASCRYYGIYRQCYDGWLRRYQADGLDGSKYRSSRPYHSPKEAQAEVIEKIVWLRKHSPVSGALVTRSSSKGRVNDDGRPGRGTDLPRSRLAAHVLAAEPLG